VPRYGDHDLTLDIGFYLDYARNCGSPILELACGTGRVLVPLVEADCEVHGVDISENMLAVCRRKVEKKGLRERLVPLASRYIFRFELQLLLERAGFELIELFRDYERRPYDGTGEMIAVARRPG